MVGVLLRSACGAVESVHLSICLSVHHQGFAGEGGAVLGGRPCGEEEEAGTKTQSRGQLPPFSRLKRCRGPFRPRPLSALGRQSHCPRCPPSTQGLEKS